MSGAVEEAKAYIQSAPIVGADETGFGHLIADGLPSSPEESLVVGSRHPVGHLLSSNAVALQCCCSIELCSKDYPEDIFVRSPVEGAGGECDLTINDCYAIAVRKADQKLLRLINEAIDYLDEPIDEKGKTRLDDMIEKSQKEYKKLIDNDNC